MDDDCIVLSSDTESSADIMTDHSEDGEDSELDESEGTFMDSDLENESDESIHEGDTEDESEIEEIEPADSDVDEEVETEDEVLNNEGEALDEEDFGVEDTTVMTGVAWPELPPAGDTERWAPILEALGMSELTYAPVVMPIHHVCSQCCLLFTHPWDLTRHMVTHVGQDSQACIHCLEKFKDALTLEEHTASEHQEKLEKNVKSETDLEREAQRESEILEDLKQIDEYTDKIGDDEIKDLEKIVNSPKHERNDKMAGEQGENPKKAKDTPKQENEDNIADDQVENMDQTENSPKLDKTDKTAEDQVENLVKATALGKEEKMDDDQVVNLEQIGNLPKQEKTDKMVADQVENLEKAVDPPKLEKTDKVADGQVKNIEQTGNSPQQGKTERMTVDQVENLKKTESTGKQEEEEKMVEELVGNLDQTVDSPKQDKTDKLADGQVEKMEQTGNSPKEEKSDQQVESPEKTEGLGKQGKEEKMAEIQVGDLEQTVNSPKREKADNIADNQVENLDKTRRSEKEGKEEKVVDEQVKNLKQISPKQEKIHSCFHCSQSCATLWELTRHQINHAGEKLNKCTHCGKYFPDSDKLKVHVKTHPEEENLQCVIEIDTEPHPEVLEMMINKVNPVVNKVKPVIPKVKPVKPVKPVIPRRRPETFECAYCHDVYGTLSGLNTHIKNLHKCPKCPKMLSNNAERRRHMQTHEPPKHRCSYCKTKFFPTVQLLKAHMKSSHECTQCGKTLRHITDFNQHMLLHEQDKLMKMMARAPKFTIDTSKKPHGCCQCDTKFCCPYDLTRHMLSHVIPQGESCPSCTQAFKDAANLDQHIASVHSAHPQKAANSDSTGSVIPKTGGGEQTEQKVKDLDAQRDVEIEAALKQIDEYKETDADIIEEIQPKQGLKLHMCNECGNSYGTPWDLTRHSISHIGQTLTTCPECKLIFTNTTRLDEHMETHVKQSFLCPYCAEEFTTELEFDVHMTAHDEDTGTNSCDEGLKEQSSSQKPYDCTVCDAAFSHSQEYINHMMGHSKDKSKRDRRGQKSSTSRDSGRYRENRANPDEFSQRYLPQASEGFSSSSSSSQRGKNVQLVRPMIASNSTPVTQPNSNLTRSSAREQPAMTPHVTQMYLPGTSSSSLASVNTSRHNMGNLYSSTMGGPGQSEIDNSMLYPVIAPSISSASLPSSYEHLLGHTSDLSAVGTNQYEANRNIQGIQPMSSFDDLVAALATNETLSGAGRQHETSRNTQAMQAGGSQLGTVAASVSSSRRYDTSLSGTQHGDRHDMYSNVAQGSQHMSSHAGRSSHKPHPCSQCSERFASIAELDQHFRIHIRGKDSFLDLPGEQAAHKCSHCSKTFSTFDELNRHKIIHHDSSLGFVDRMDEASKPHQCPICGQRFAVIWDVENHMATHAMPGFQACFICKRWFDTALQLREHQATHREDISKSSSSSHGTSHSSSMESRKRAASDFTDNPISLDDLIKHRRLYSDDSLSAMTSNPSALSVELPHVCYICGLGFSHPTTLRDHMFTHSAEVPQSCAICQQWFSTTAGLIQHQMLHH